MAEYIEREALKLKVQRYLMPNVDADGTVSVRIDLMTHTSVPLVEKWLWTIVLIAPTAEQRWTERMVRNE